MSTIQACVLVRLGGLAGLVCRIRLMDGWQVCGRLQDLHKESLLFAGTALPLDIKIRKGTYSLYLCLLNKLFLLQYACLYGDSRLVDKGTRKKERKRDQKSKREREWSARNFPHRRGRHTCGCLTQAISDCWPYSRVRGAIRSSVLLYTKLRERPEYHALSYAWGSAEVTRPIRVDKATVQITINLESALRHLRQKDKPFIVWADALVCSIRMM